MSRGVKRALQRMEDGAYGICLSCEDPITPKRLQAVPWAELCLNCQERSDLKAGGVLGADQDQGVEVESRRRGGSRLARNFCRPTPFPAGGGHLFFRQQLAKRGALFSVTIPAAVLDHHGGGDNAD